MTIQDWGAVGELVGAIAVIISLVYLALQLRQNTKAMRTSAAWDAEVIWGKSNFEAAHNPESAILMSRGSSENASESDFSETEIAQLYLLVRGCFQVTQAQWWLWKGGSLPDEVWEMRKTWAANFIQAPVVNSIWQGELKQFILTDEFVQDILSATPEGKLSYSPISTSE